MKGLELTIVVWKSLENSGERGIRKNNRKNSTRQKQHAYPAKLRYALGVRYLYGVAHLSSGKRGSSIVVPDCCTLVTTISPS